MSDQATIEPCTRINALLNLAASDTKSAEKISEDVSGFESLDFDAAEVYIQLAIRETIAE
jgi:hypothetical protein